MNEPLPPHILQRIRAEYLEMPGIALKPEQVQRLCGIDSTACQSVLEALVQSGFLSRRADGAYGRDRSPDISRARQAKAGLEPGAGVTHAHIRLRAS